MRGAKRAEWPGIVRSGVISLPRDEGVAVAEAATESQRTGKPAQASAKRKRSLSPDICVEGIPGNVLP